MKSLLITLLILTALADRSLGKTWVIQVDGSGDAPTIQAGIDSAAVADTVLVGPGTYLEHPNFLGKDIVLKSAMGPQATTLDGSLGLETWVVALRTGETRDAVLEGFRITGGLRGISIRDSEPTITSNLIEQNETGISATANPSPITFRPLICGNSIVNNVSEINGGGLSATVGMAPQVIDNVIVGNQAVAGDGGGIYMRLGDPGTRIIGNLIVDNFAGDHGGGMVVVWNPLVGSVDMEISWNVIQWNQANGIGGADFEGGGGMYLVGTNAWVHHNTLVNNSGALDAGASGGGITLSYEQNPLIEQNIIAYSPTGKAVACFDSENPVFRNNLVWMNYPENIGGICEPFWINNGNVVADPDFCNWEGGDISLGINSPALKHPAGPLGAIGAPGCRGTTPVFRTTWGQMKTKYLN